MNARAVKSNFKKFEQKVSEYAFSLSLFFLTTLLSGIFVIFLDVRDIKSSYVTKESVNKIELRVTEIEKDVEKITDRFNSHISVIPYKYNQSRR